MKFDFYTKNCASNNSGEAQLRESTRMCAIAYGLSHLGHEVRIVDAPNSLRESERWDYFRHLSGDATDGLRVVPAEVTKGDIGIKCSVGTKRDAEFVGRFSVVVAHEYDERLSDDVLKVPFLIHNALMDEFVQMGLFRAYLDNDLEAIREAFPRKPNGRVAFCGKNWRHRVEALRLHPYWADIRFYDTPPMTGAEHARWICGYSGGICLPGDTPKTRLPPLLAMLGVPIVMWPIRRVDTPPIDETNALLFESWEKLELHITDKQLTGRITSNATRDYLESWSPIGQARLIAESVNA